MPVAFHDLWSLDANFANFTNREFIAIVGPSGAGKSLTIQALAGLVRPTAGSIRVGGEVLYDSTGSVEVPAHRRRIGYVPQHHSLFPFRDVAANVAFGLPRRERTRDNPRVKELLEELGIRHLAAAHRALTDGVPLHGFFVWSLMDNFEWDQGYEKRFGLYRVEYDSQRRIAKDSAFWYRDVVAANAVDNGKETTAQRRLP